MSTYRIPMVSARSRFVVEVGDLSWTHMYRRSVCTGRISIVTDAGACLHDSRFRFAHDPSGADDYMELSVDQDLPRGVSWALRQFLLSGPAGEHHRVEP